MTPEQVKEKLEGVKWINKEIEGLYLELVALEVAEEIGVSTASVYRVRQKAIEHLAGMVNGN